MNAQATPDAAVTAAWEALRESRDHLRSPTRGDLEAALRAASSHIIAAWINDASRLPRDLPGYGPEGRML